MIKDMKKLLLLFILLAALPCAAQRHLLKEAAAEGVFKKALGKTAGEDILRQARVVQGKILPGGKMPRAAVPSDLEKYIFKQVRPTPIGYLPVLFLEPSQMPIEDISLLYKRVMQYFQAFKKEMDVFLYYQSKPSERREFSSAEQAMWSEKIGLMNAQLLQLKNLISQHDPAYQAAREYMVFAAETVNPMLRGILEQRTFARTDRQYTSTEFFLHTPQALKETAWTEWLPLSVRTNQVARRLPEGLRMAVLNDEPSVLAAMQREHQNRFCPTWELATYSEADDLLQAVRRGAEFDVILTDLIVPGGGGYYLVSALREKGFNGAIFGLSAYPEESRMGWNMFQRGFDGMIPAPIGFEQDRNWPRLVMKKLQNYFYYRDLNGWSR